MVALTGIRSLAAVLTDVAFRTVQLRRAAAEPEGPTLVLANHGGGLADILVVVRSCRRFPRFLARDVIWRVPVIGPAVMGAVRAIPVSRRQDHHDGADNTSMFAAAFDGLAAGDLLAIYPEGESVPEPRLAPLRTGAARIALGALSRGIDTAIVPMGLHYFDVSVLRGRCFVDVGPTLRMSQVVGGLDPALGAPAEDNHALVRAVTDVFAEKLAAVVDEYDGWEDRRRYEGAAVTYLSVTDPSAASGDSVDYERVAAIASRIGRAPAASRTAVDDAMRAFEADLEILGLPPDKLSTAGLAGTKVAAQTGLLLLLAPPAAFGAVVNAVPMALLRGVSMTGMAPATAATVKPAVAALAFPAAWALLARAGYHRWGPVGSVVLGMAGPASLLACVGFTERAELMFYIGRAYRRARGDLATQVRHAGDAVAEAVAQAIGAPPPARAAAATSDRPTTDSPAGAMSADPALSEVLQ